MVSMLPPRNPLRPPRPRLPGLFPTRILSPGCVIATAFAPDSGVLSTMVVGDAPKTTSEVGEEFSAHEGRGRARPLPDIQVRCLRAWGHAGPAVPSGQLSAWRKLGCTSPWVCRLLSDLVVPGMCV